MWARAMLAAGALWASGAFVAVAAAPSDTLPAGAVGAHLRAYVDAVNGAQAAAESFGQADLSPAFSQPHSAAGLQRYFYNQHRVTGGVTPVGFRFDPGSTTRGRLVFRDTIYGALRAITFVFDETPQRRIVDLYPTPAPAWALPSRRDLAPERVAAYASALIERGCRADVFSGAFLVAHDGKVLVARACGEADRRAHVANTVDTQINLGSMNKMFTAVAVAQLVQQGRLAPTDRLSTFVDESWLPRAISDRITVRQLLTMTSGLGSYFDDGPVSRFQANRTLEAYKPVIRAQTLLAPPGAKFIYSDTGYFLLGLVVQKASGEDYYDYVRRHIYAPAGMTRTDSFQLDDPAVSLARGYVFVGGADPWRENSDFVIKRGAADGGGYSTIGDLLRFAEALKAGKLVSATSLARLWTDHPPSHWGEGFYVYASPAGRIVGKDGFGAGISSEMDVFRDRGYVVVALSNYASGAPAPMDAMRAEIASAK